MNESLDQFHSFQKQPEALRLADAIVSDLAPLGRWNSIDQASTELRRLHAVNQELLEALRDMVDSFCWGDLNAGEHGALEAARATIGKATGGAV